jgi:phospholipid/cholesterol/gamma-HCH transport system permease protein
MPKVAASPGSVDWRSLPKLVQEIGADALPVTALANLLIGIIVGFLGVSQLGRFGAVAFVPQLVIVAQFRELGPMITAVVVAGRSGAGIASEIGTMKVSEEIDALRSMGFDPVRWLVVPRCLALNVDDAASDVDWECHGPGRWSSSDDGDHEHDCSQLCRGNLELY